MVRSFQKQVSLPLSNQVSHTLFPEAITVTYAKTAYVYTYILKGGWGGECVCVFQSTVSKKTLFSKILIE